MEETLCFPQDQFHEDTALQTLARGVCVGGGRGVVLREAATLSKPWVSSPRTDVDVAGPAPDFLQTLKLRI